MRSRLIERLAVEVDQLPAIRPDAIVTGHVMVVIVVHPVAVVHRLAPGLRRVAFQVVTETRALHLLRSLQSGVVQEHRREIDIQRDVAIHAAGRDRSRVSHDERHTQRFLVHQALVEPAVIAEIEALIAGVDHDRVRCEAARVEIIEHAAHVIVHALNAA